MLVQLEGAPGAPPDLGEATVVHGHDGVDRVAVEHLVRVRVRVRARVRARVMVRVRVRVRG